MVIEPFTEHTAFQRFSVFFIAKKQYFEIITHCFKFLTSLITANNNPDIAIASETEIFSAISI
jgi:hypothetical protein